MPLSVALLTEGVDRNACSEPLYVGDRVALLTEGVDRNNLSKVAMPQFAQVALLTEGVDRNGFDVALIVIVPGRPPHGGRG